MREPLVRSGTRRRSARRRRTRDDPAAAGTRSSRAPSRRPPRARCGARSVTCRSQDLPDQAHDLGAGVQELTQHRAVLGALPRPRVMPNEVSVACFSVSFVATPEELGVARVRARPAALDVRHAQLVELVQDPQAVLDRVREAGALGAVAERRVVELDLERGVTRSPPPRRGRRPRPSCTPSRRRASRSSSSTPGGCRRRRDVRLRSSPSESSSICDRTDRRERVDRALARRRSGAVPPIGSNIETPSGLMFPPAAMPMPPWIMAPRSVMMSPNMLSVTITSNRPG